MIKVEKSWPIKPEIISALLKFAKWTYVEHYQKDERKMALDFLSNINNHHASYSEIHFNHMKLTKKEIKALFGELE